LPDFVPATYTTEDVAKGFAPFNMKDARVLLPRADLATEMLSNGLRTLGASLDEVSSYHTVTPPGSREKARELLTSGSIDTITFTSSSTVRNLVELLNGDLSLFANVRVVSIGPVTSAAAHELGVHVDIEASEHTVEGVIVALAAALSNQSSHKELDRE
jgi:uroporphyrinogen-III synthase